jgi:hypothetical protein
MSYSEDLIRRSAAHELEESELKALGQEVRSEGYLERELVKHLHHSRMKSREWKAQLEEVCRQGYHHKVSGTEALYLKYTALELQALCGLAQLISSQVRRTDDSDTDEPADK